MHWYVRARGVHLVVLGLLIVLRSVVSLPLSHAQESQGLGLAVVSVGTTVREMDRTLAFYQDVLEFEPRFDVEFTDPGYDRLVGVFGTRVRVVGLSLGPNQIELTQFITPWGRDIPPDSRSNDAWFQHLALVVTDIERATARLRTHGVQFVSPAPQRFPDGRAFLYFNDPDGHPLELAEFPGESPVTPHKLFQRIDHSALVVRDLNASLIFYQRLGFQVTNRAEGLSLVQERLNNVFGLHLEIVSLRLPQGGMGIELLHYLTPPGGRPFPADTRSNDLAHRHVTITTPKLAETFQSLRQARADLRSPEVASFTAGSLGQRRAFAVADPTGHVIEVVEGP